MKKLFLFCFCCLHKILSSALILKFLFSRCSLFQRFIVLIGQMTQTQPPCIVYRLFCYSFCKMPFMLKYVGNSAFFHFLLTSPLLSLILVPCVVKRADCALFTGCNSDDLMQSVKDLVHDLMLNFCPLSSFIFLFTTQRNKNNESRTERCPPRPF